MQLTPRTRPLLIGGLTAVFIGYLSVWLPGPGVGLSFIGVELGEWIKFLGVGQSRNWFYLPPITLGLIIALLTTSWSNRRWQTWMMRGLAVGISLFAFPSIEAIRFEPTSEWLLRLTLIGLVTVVVSFSGIVARGIPKTWQPKPLLILLGVLGLVGAIMPTWIYLTVRPIVSQAIGLPVGIGLGVWFNGVGHLLVTAVALYHLYHSPG